MTIFLSTIISTLISLNGLFLSDAGQVATYPINQVQSQTLAQRDLSLENRHVSESVNKVFKDNILLNLAYMNGSVQEKSDIDWSSITSGIEASFVLEPGETFAYHNHVYPKYEDSIAVTTNTYFNAGDGYLFSGFLYGDGVCHLASIINWAAQDAGLEVEVPKLHSIAKIPDVPDQYGVSIYTIEGQDGSGVGNNLYITNNQDYSVEFVISYQEGEDLTVEVVKKLG